MKVIVIPIVIGVLGTIPKGFLKGINLEIRRRVETIQTTALSSKLATLVEGDPKASFSIATTLRCKEGRYPIPLIAPLYLWFLPYNAEC